MLITADDMNWDAVGAFGCPTAGTTPNIDRLAAEGLRFKHSISGIDYLPTVLDAIGVDIPDGVNGKSLLPGVRMNS